MAAEPTAEQWLEAFRRAVEAQKAVFAEHEGIAVRTRYEGRGEGGDRTLVIDRLCEDAIFAELEVIHEEGHDFTAVSEERGTVSFGDPAAPTRVVIDPIDGSLNARRTIPLHSFCVGVADGGTMADVRIGYVFEFGAGEEFAAVAGEGATLDGRTLSVASGDGLELVAMEASKPERVIAASRALEGKAYRLRCPGSIAVSLCYVASGRVDGMLTTRPCRSVDAAGAQLIVAEAGGRLAFGTAPPAETGLGLDSRFHCVAARTDADLATLLSAQEELG